MTCIVGLVCDEVVLVGADSAGVASNYSHIIQTDMKVFQKGSFLIGYTTSFRMGQLLRYAFTPPSRRVDCDLMAYMATDFVDAVRQCLRDGGFQTTKDHVEKGGDFLVAHAGRLFTIQSDYAVLECLTGRMAVGCGADLALGALHATRDTGIDEEQRIRLALEAAATYSAGVSRPFAVLRLEADA